MTDDDDFPDSPIPTLVSRRTVRGGPNYAGQISEGTEADFPSVVTCIHLCGDIRTMVSMCQKEDPAEGWTDNFPSFSFSFDDGNTWLMFPWELAWRLARELCGGCHHTSPVGLGAIQAMLEWGRARGIEPPPPIHPAPEGIQ